MLPITVKPSEAEAPFASRIIKSKDNLVNPVVNCQGFLDSSKAQNRGETMLLIHDLMEVDADDTYIYSE